MVEPGASSLRRLRRSAFLPALLLVLAACAKAASTGGGASPTGTPMSIPALKLAVLAGVGGHLDYCDPDLYPIAQGDPIDAARQRFPMIQADRQAFAAILQFEGLTEDQRFTDEQLLAINADYKQMQAIQLEPDGALYRFSFLVPQAGSDVGNQRVSGTVDRFGSVKVEKREIGKKLPCPICLAAGDRIATPSGEVLVQDVRVGMQVWTTDREGRRIVGVVLETGHMEAPPGHGVVRITLADGRTVTASPSHPTADGRRVGSLRAGERLDGSRIVAVDLIPYGGGATYDLLPSGPTGTYFADGVLLGSTLRSYGR